MKIMISLSSTIYWYGLKARPYGPAQVPNGESKHMPVAEARKWVKMRGIPESRYRHGLVGYPKRLDKSTVSAFELEDIFGTIEPDFAGKSKESKATVLEFVLNELKEKIDYLELPIKSAKVVGMMVTIVFAGNSKSFKFGFKGDNLAVPGVNKVWRISDQTDAEVAAMDLFYLIEDNYT